MMGEWNLTSNIGDENDSWRGTLHVLEGTEEHFEGDNTGVLTKFKAKDGVWSAVVAFDDGEDGDTYTLKGTYDEDDTAECSITPGAKNKDKQAATWNLSKYD